MAEVLSGAKGTIATENRFLQVLPPQLREQIEKAGQIVQFRHGQLLHSTILDVRYMFFITEGLVLTQTAHSGGAVGTGVIGKTGVLGTMAALGIARSSSRALCATDGTAIRLPVERAGKLIEAHPILRQALLEQAYAQFNALGFIAFCNAMHRAQQKLQRWLLVAEHHAETRDICVSHELMAKALGVRRPTVSESLKLLEQTGAVQTARRCVSIVSDTALLEGCCTCHKRIIREYRLANEAQKNLFG